MDLKPKRGRFTWSNNRSGVAHIAARLEHFMLQSYVLLENKILSTSILPKLMSDHMPIMLKLEDEENLGPIPFRFSPLWIARDDFMDTVSNAWIIQVTSSPNFMWERKLNNTKLALKAWIKSLPSTLSIRNQALENLAMIQLEMEVFEITT